MLFSKCCNKILQKTKYGYLGNFALLSLMQLTLILCSARPNHYFFFKGETMNKIILISTGVNQHAVTLSILKKYFLTKLELLWELDAYELLQNSFSENSLGRKRFQRVSNKVTLQSSLRSLHYSIFKDRIFEAWIIWKYLFQKEIIDKLRKQGQRSPIHPICIHTNSQYEDAFANFINEHFVLNPFGSSLKMSLADLTMRRHLGLTHVLYIDNFEMCRIKPVAYNGLVRWFDYQDPLCNEYEEYVSYPHWSKLIRPDSTSVYDQSKITISVHLEHFLSDRDKRTFLKTKNESVWDDFDMEKVLRELGENESKNDTTRSLPDFKSNP